MVCGANSSQYRADRLLSRIVKLMPQLTHVQSYKGNAVVQKSGLDVVALEMTSMRS